MRLSNRKNPQSAPGRSRGAALVVSLILLLILTMIGVTVARMQTVEERMSRNETNHQLALQAAEAALRNAEAGITDSLYGNFDANGNGMFALNPSNGSIYDQWLAGSAPSGTWLSYTAATNAGPALSNALLAAQPVYVIESLPPVAIPGDSLANVQFGSATPPINIYRITARATGGDATSNSTVQSLFR
jgi:type IV pilus assembly protein PilX